MLTNGARVAVVVIVEFIALVIAAYACFVAFILLPPGVGGGSQDSPTLAAEGIGALLVSIVMPATGLVIASFLWHSRVWLLRSAVTIGAMVVLWSIFFLLFPR